MPRIANETSALLADLHARIQAVVETARKEGHDQALASIRSLVGGGSVAYGIETGNPFVQPDLVRRGPGRPKGSKNKPKAYASSKPKQKRKNSWAGLSPAARLARINAIRKGKGLPPKSE
jgi:hypothetical protein